MLNQITESPFTLLGVAAVYLVAVATLRLGLGSMIPEPSSNERYASLDGLRGLLALLVLSHHSLYWYGKSTNGSWTMPSVLYENLGKSSVALFFMVSSFLFYSKILAAPSIKFDWLRFAVSRLFRLTPLYLCAMVFLLIEVGIASQWRLNTDPQTLASTIFSWLSFTIFGHPEINQVKETGLMTAGVVWSLVYEWIFYAALPLLALISARRVPYITLLLSLVISLFLYKKIHPNPVIMAAFLGGIIAAIIVRWGKLNSFLKSSWLAPILIFIVYKSWTLHYTPWNLETLLLLTIIFTAIAAGNSILGILRKPLARKLGEVSYGIYLFHGLILYAIFQLSPIGQQASLKQPFFYLAVILAITMLTVAISSIGFRLIEAPAMALVNPITTNLRNRLRLLRQS